MNVKLLSLVAIAATLASAPLFATTTSFQESFDGVGNGLSLQTVGQFSAVNTTNVDVIDAGGDGYFDTGHTPGALEFGHVVDLGGTGTNPFGQLQTTIDLAAGNYLLTFDLAGSQRAGYTSGTTTKVTVGNVTENISQLSYDPANAYQISFTSNGTPTLLNFSLVESQNGNVGSLLDNVSIVKANTSPTPEPNSLFLLGSGFAALAGLARRKFAAAKA